MIVLNMTELRIENATEKEMLFYVKHRYFLMLAYLRIISKIRGWINGKRQRF